MYGNLRKGRYCIKKTDINHTKAFANCRGFFFEQIFIYELFQNTDKRIDANANALYDAHYAKVLPKMNR